MTRGSTIGIVAMPFEDSGNDAGTYLKVFRFSTPSNPDAFVVIYLRPEGSFLALGYWRGFERSVAAGHWSRRGAEIELDGRGELTMDCPSDAPSKFQRIMTTDRQEQTPILVVASELAGWSLLGRVGTFTYVGRDTIINPHGDWLPPTIKDVDLWIDRLLSP